MSKAVRVNELDSRAVAVMDEIFAVGIVIMIFSAGTFFCIKLTGLNQKEIEGGELYDDASKLSKLIRNHEHLIYGGQTGVFDSVKLAEHEKNDQDDLVTVPDRCSLDVIIIDYFDPRYVFKFTITAGGFSFVNDLDSEKAVVESPVNMQLNELEIHPAKLTVVLRR